MRKFCFSLVIFLIFFVSCSTTISTYVERPAELDLGGAKKVAVIPFEIQSSSHFDYRRRADEEKSLSKISDFLTEEFAKDIRASNHFELANKLDVLTALKRNFNPPCDVYISGIITDYRVNFEKKNYTRTVTKKDGKKEVENFPKYAKRIKFTIHYDIISARDNYSLYSENYKIDEISSYNEKKHELPDEFDLIEEKLFKFQQAVIKKMIPYDEKIEFKLLSDKNPEMKEAEQMADNGNLDSALEQYLLIYDSTHYQSSENFAAGYNAAQIMVVKGQLYEARELMLKLKMRGDSRALKSLSRINSEIYYAEKLERQKKARESNFIDAK